MNALFHTCLVCSFLIALLPAKPLTLSVLYFENLSKDSKFEHVPKALCGMLTTDLSGVQGITVVERENLEKVTRELALGQTGLVDEASAPKVGKVLGADYLISGTILPQRRTMVITFKVLMVENSKVCGGATVNGRPDKIAQTEAQLLQAVCAAFKNITTGIKAQVNQVDTQEVSLDNLEDYGKALALSDAGEYDQAKSILETVVKDVPHFVHGKNSLDEIQRRIAAYDRTRQDTLAKAAKAPLTWPVFQQVTIGYVSSMQYTRLLAYCLDIRSTPPDAPQGSLISTREQIDYYIAFCYYSLKKWQEALDEGEHFLKTYPASMYYGSIKLFVSQAAQEAGAMLGKKKAADAEAQPLMKKAQNEKGGQRAYLQYQIGQLYSNAGFPKEALPWFSAIKPEDLRQFGMEPDMILYSIFMCYYNLFDKKDAQKVYSAVQQTYPQSKLLSAMTPLLAMFPE
jgi:TolB-like protein